MRRWHAYLTVLIVMVSLMVFAAAPAAACRAAVTLEEAVAHAGYIIIGHVTPAGDPYWYGETDPAGMGRVIITPLDVVVVETLKGPALPGDTLRICQTGGQIGDTMMMSTAEQYIGSGTYLLFLSPHWDSQAGLRVAEAWTFAGDTLDGNIYWPTYGKLSKLKAEISEAVGRETGAPFGIAGGADVAEGAGGAAGPQRADPGTVVVAGLLGGYAVQKLKVRRGRPGR
jgi:hypothetical protein